LLTTPLSKVDRALTLCINDDYDFVTNKLIPKPDPNHPNRKPTINMFSFSEACWKPKVDLYLEKGIGKLKEKDWKNILNAVAKCSNFVKPSQSTGKILTQEELELVWDSESDDGEAGN
jgi:hypothetical protein